MNYLKRIKGKFEDLSLKNKLLAMICSNVLLILTAAMMIYSAVKYFQIFREIFHSDDAQYELSLHDEIRAKTVREKRKRP